jgi:hypothetical protein
LAPKQEERKARPRSLEGKTMNSGKQDQELLYIVRQGTWEGKTKKSGRQEKEAWKAHTTKESGRQDQRLQRKKNKS